MVDWKLGRIVQADHADRDLAVRADDPERAGRPGVHVDVPALTSWADPMAGLKRERTVGRAGVPGLAIRGTNETRLEPVPERHDHQPVEL
jgi:hypothetical protein